MLRVFCVCLLRAVFSGTKGQVHKGGCNAMHHPTLSPDYPAPARIDTGPRRNPGPTLSRRGHVLTLDKIDKPAVSGRCLLILVVRKVQRSRAAHVAPVLCRGLRRPVTPSASSFSRKAPSVRWSATPPGTAHGTRMCRRGGAPIRSAPARHGPRPLRSRLPSRARAGVTGGASTAFG